MPLTTTITTSTSAKLSGIDASTDTPNLSTSSTTLFRKKCLGCQDGFLVHYLTVFRHWRYKRISLNYRDRNNNHHHNNPHNNHRVQLHSIIFHGPSPLLCVRYAM